MLQFQDLIASKVAASDVIDNGDGTLTIPTEKLGTSLSFDELYYAIRCGYEAVTEAKKTAGIAQRTWSELSNDEIHDIRVNHILDPNSGLGADDPYSDLYLKVIAYVMNFKAMMTEFKAESTQ